METNGILELVAKLGFPAAVLCVVLYGFWKGIFPLLRGQDKFHQELIESLQELAASQQNALVTMAAAQQKILLDMQEKFLHALEEERKGFALVKEGLKELASTIKQSKG